MIPIVFDKTATSFNNLGLGGVSDALDCIVTEERNKSFTLSLTAPANSARADDLAVGNIIVADASPLQRMQAFDIVSVDESLDRIEVTAEHLSYRLGYALVKPFSVNGITAMISKLNTAATWVGDTLPGFSFASSGITSAATCALANYETGRNVLGGVRGSMLDTYGGTWQFDNFTATLYASRGTGSGLRIIYGKNLKAVSAEYDLTDTITGVFGVWTQNDAPVVTTSQIWETANASSYPFPRNVIHDFADEFQSQPTQAQLDTAAAAWISGKGDPSMNLTLDWIPLSQTIEYKDIPSGVIGIDDTVQIYIHPLGIYTSAKCIATQYNALLDRYESVQVGNFRETLADAIRRLK